MLTRLRTSLLILILIYLCGLTTYSRAPQSPPGGALAAVGAQPERGYFSQLPFERIDMVNGNVSLSFTDLVLPGNAGMDLRLTRSYNHQRTPGSGPTWSFGFGGVPLRVVNPAQVPPDPWKPTLLMADGSEHPLHENVMAGVLVTTDFWRYDASTRTLSLPNGWVATYTADPAARLIRVDDAFGNAIVPEWQEWATGFWRIWKIVQTLDEDGGPRTRTVEYAYTDSTNLTLPTSMSYDGRTWTYGYQGYSRLTSVHAPAGPDWAFAYNLSGNDGTITVTTPAGGTVTYDFDGQDLSGARSVLRTRTTGGREISGGSWTFGYEINGSLATSTVTTPSNRQLAFTHQHRSGANGFEWTLESRTLSQGGASSSLSRTYTGIPFGAFSLWAVDDQTIQQDGITYTTDFSYDGNHFGDFRRAKQITESASNHATTRVTTRTFDYNFTTRWIITKVASETVTVSGESFGSSAEHDDVTGFQTERTTLGLETIFVPDGGGNPTTTIDPLNHQATLPFAWGVPSGLLTSEMTVTRQINSDGTIAWETRAGATTSYSYDALGRVTSVAPPEGSAANTSYEPDGSAVTVSRGPSWVRTTVDGFGRPIQTESADGVRTTTGYDSEGRAWFQSYPYVSGGPPGDVISHDFLGRVTRVTHVDGKFIDYSHGPGTVTTVDENNHRTIQYFQAFGNPGNARLVSLLDQADKVWSYSHNALGSVTRVDGPEGPDRVWAYNEKNQIVSETQPESGTTTYTYRADGLVWTTTNGLGTITYSYDGDHRLTGVDAPGTADDTAIYYYSSGVRSLAVMGTGNETRFTYDAANRLIGREDRISGQIYNTTFNYDTRDNLIKITYPSLRAVQYDYDAANRIIKVYSGSQIFADAISYHPSGARSALAFGNGTSESLTFDDRYRPSHLLTGAAADRVDLTYGFDWHRIHGTVGFPDHGRSLRSLRS